MDIASVLKLKKIDTQNIKRVFIISDTHFGIKSNNLDWINVQEAYFNDFLIPLLKREYKEGDILIHCGDVFDNRQSLHLLVLNKAISIFEKLSKILPIFIIAGNHDLFKKQDTEINSLKCLKWLPNTVIFENYNVIDTKDMLLLFSPWTTPEEQKENIDITLQRSKRKSLLFCHSNIQGIQYNKYVKIENGNTADDFSKVTHVYSGHIHYAQQMKNITYIGCPYSLTRNDIDNIKGVYLHDLKNDTQTFFENTLSPKFIRIPLEDLFEMTVSEINTIIENNFVDLLSDIKWTTQFPFSLFIDMIEGYRSIEIHTYKALDDSSIIVDADTGEIDERTLETTFNILTVLPQYINTLPYDTDIKDRIQNEIIGIYDTIKNDI